MDKSLKLKLSSFCFIVTFVIFGLSVWECIKENNDILFLCAILGISISIFILTIIANYISKNFNFRHVLFGSLFGLSLVFLAISIYGFSKSPKNIYEVRCDKKCDIIENDSTGCELKYDDYDCSLIIDCPKKNEQIPCFIDYGCVSNECNTIEEMINLYLLGIGGMVMPLCFMFCILMFIMLQIDNTSKNNSSQINSSNSSEYDLLIGEKNLI